MKNILVLIIITACLSVNLFADSLYIDNFNDKASPNLLGGPYAYDAWGSQIGAVSITYESNTPFGNAGASLKFNYVINGSDAYAQIKMNIYPDQILVNLTNYDYLSFRIKGENGGEVCRIYLQDSANNWPAVNIKDFLPEGKVTTEFQKVVVPLTAFRYSDFIETEVSNIFFWVSGEIYQGSTSLYIDELIFAQGAGPIYIDNAEVPGSPDLSALGFDLYDGGDGATVRKMTNDCYSGSNAYYVRHITDVPNTYWAQSVWQFRYSTTPYVDASACDTLQFYAKQGSAKSSEKLRYIRLGCDGENPAVELNALGLSTTWQRFDIPLSDFSDLVIERLADFKLVAELNGGTTTNITYLDEIKLIDNTTPQAPTNIRVNSIKMSNEFIFNNGLNTITAVVWSNEDLDKSLEAVYVEYRKNSGSWKIISFDYDTDKKDFTNVWSTMQITGTNNIDIRVTCLDSTSNRSIVQFDDCSINTEEPENSFMVTFSNVDTPGIINFLNVPNNDIPVVATNSSGLVSFAHIEYDVQTPSPWKIIVYTDNTNSSADPRYEGPGNLLYGTINDGTGLVGDGGVATNIHSTPLYVWCTAKDEDGNFAYAPCDNWKGSGDLQGVPDPSYEGGETNLYWKKQNLNGNSSTNDTIETNAHWSESDVTPAYDANGDGDTLDNWTTLGKVYERSCWRPITSSDTKVPGANTVILMDNTMNSSMPGQFKVYFTVTDDFAGNFKTDQLYIELIIQ